MEQIKDLITKILDNGHAYIIEGDVYFSVDTFADYYCLSGRKPDDNRAGGGGRVTVDTRKRNPADFALWKSRAACPQSNVKYWMHNGFVNRDNQKMSKSDNNFCTIRDEIAFVPFRNESFKGVLPVDVKEQIDKFHTEYLSSMSDDLHTTTVLDDLVDLLKLINGTLKKFKGKKQQQVLILSLLALEKEVKEVLLALGLSSSYNVSEVLQQLKDKALKRAGYTEEEVGRKIEERNMARKSKEYEKSDKIREELYLRGIALMDEPTGTIWETLEPPEKQSGDVLDHVSLIARFLFNCERIDEFMSTTLAEMLKQQQRVSSSSRARRQTFGGRMAYALRHCIREPATALGRVTNLLLFSGHGLRYRKLEVILTTEAVGTPRRFRLSDI
ncbi:hypothetical protein HPP92_008678 [Vanilla planifolia]|uniref:tRNA synthetases class I catalytic domain-containing protein n=1 Tax=Vanilla planifolia TaxID=51239 RepID=A0A835RA33_VANPL|nr:hypothetical protein HPP92_008678 [Vanilla planifolia]